jgi:hypothetical protein
VRRRTERREPPLIKPFPALLALIAGIGLSATIALASSTELGQTTSTPTFPVNTPIVPVSTVAGTPSYETPAGVLTRWRFHSRDEPSPGSIKLKVFRLTGTSGVYEVVGDSSLEALSPDTSYEFQERISVKKGDLLGLLADGDADIGMEVPGTAGNRIGQFGGGDIPVGSTGTTTTEWPNLRVAVAATVESDADGDGFGDDSQDACPTDATRQGACPAPAPADKTAPVQTSKAKRSQDVDKLTVFVTLNEAGTVTAGAGVNVPAAARRFAFRRVTRTLAANVRTKFRIKLKRTALRRVKKALKHGRRLRARVTLTARDAAANTSVRKLSVRLKNSSPSLQNH